MIWICITYVKLLTNDTLLNSILQYYAVKRDFLGLAHLQLDLYIFGGLTFAVFSWTPNCPASVVEVRDAPLKYCPNCILTSVIIVTTKLAKLNEFPLV